MKKIYGLLAIICFAGIFASCKKDSKNNGNNTNGNASPNDPGTALDKMKDSIYLYAKEDYLWNTQLPTYAKFTPRVFSDPEDFTALQLELNALSQYAVNPTTGKPYELRTDEPGIAKYSFVDDGTEQAALNGLKGDYGFNVKYNTPTDLRFEYVYAGSPAALVGITRGYQILSINGNSNISFDGVSNGKVYGSGTSTNLHFVNNAIFVSNNITMSLQKPDGSKTTVTLATANYNVNPILKDTVLDQGGGHKVGYLAFNSFVSDDVADPLLTAAFANFTSAGITDLVVDLRYNGGGYVSTAEYLDNLIVPPAKNNTLMYNSYFNANLVSGADTLLRHQWRKDPKTGKDYNYAQKDYSVAANVKNFAKAGSLNITRVFFIMTSTTASASELTINNLRPVMDVQFIGSTSYGKPVGFFDININKYTMYTPEFYVKNSVGQGDYYAGFTPGTTDYPGVADIDDLTRDFGDPKEGLLADVLGYVTTGTYSLKKPVIQSLPSNQNVFSLEQTEAAATQMNKGKFSGMILKSFKLKK